MEIQLINSETFYITQQEDIFYKRYSGTYNGIAIESVCSPDYDYNELFLRGSSVHRDCDSVRVSRDKMKQVLTALSMCCTEYCVKLTIKL